MTADSAEREAVELLHEWMDAAGVMFDGIGDCLTSEPVRREDLLQLIRAARQQASTEAAQGWHEATARETCALLDAPFLCTFPACGESCDDCNSALSPQQQRDYAIRYTYLRNRPVESIDLKDGGVFAGQVPQNVVLNGRDLDLAIDAAMPAAPQIKGADHE
jgi:hypothetical protein